LWLWAAALAVYAFLYLPLLIVVIYSFNDSRLNAEWVGFTFKWYAELFSDADMLLAARNSLLIALAASAVATVLGTMAGLAIHRYRLRILPILTLAPVAMPEILLGVSLLLFFNLVFRPWLGLELGMWSVIVAHITFCIGFVTIVVRVSLLGMDESIFEAARDLGATPWQTFRLVTFPLILPAVMAGALMSFALSWTTSSYCSPPGWAPTLPLEIYSMIRSRCPEVVRCPPADAADAGHDRARLGLHDKAFKSTAPSGSRAAAVWAVTALRRDVLHLYNWNNYISDQTLARFEASCRCRVVQDYYSDNEEMLAKLAAGASGYDLIVPTGNAVESLIKSHQLRPLDKRQLPKLRNIAPAYLDTAFDPGNRYSVPYAYTITLIGYNEQKMRELGLPTDTWALIFEPKYLARLKGRVTVLDSQRELMAAALRYLGYSVNDTDEAHWRRARDLILRAKPYWAAFNASSYIKELTVGNIWLAHGYSSDMFQARQDARDAGRPFGIAYATPREGAVLALDSMVLHKTGPRPDLAHRFIDFMLEGRNSAELTNLIGSGNPNRDAMPYIAPAIAANRAVFPTPEIRRRLEMLKDLDRNQRRVLSRMWTEIKLR
jgi:spermidine/putrescine transport system substrate-binding protein